jgi:ATP-dependent Lon protease
VIKEYGKKHKSHHSDEDKKKDSSESAYVGELTHTGRLGEVMKESVEVVKIAVFNFLTQNSHLAKYFDKDSYHLHVPMGAIPKDGPSAGISLFAALVSIATHKPVVENIAMTGEITTLGEVISIGGVREKLTACKNHSISRVILPKSNRKHVDKLPVEFKRGFTIFYVKNISQVYKICFESNLDENNSAEKKKEVYDELKALEIEVDEYEEDDVCKHIEDHENILKRNLIEELI